MTYLFAALLTVFAFVNAKAVGIDGTTKIDYDRMIANELKKTDINYQVLQQYIEDSQKGISNQQIDDLYLRIFRGVCVNGDRKEEEFEQIQKILPWQYTYSEKFLYDVASVAAFRDDRPKIGLCVFGMVSRYKIAGLEFLDVATSAAKEHNAKNLENTIMQLKQEIDKLNKNA
ncbi:MAG: hypothetical protein R8N24_00020 [Alphaproteobacteria bacterium]|nr:hypothetical protein [Alphaproteobacteria bacterium]